ncbi:hypothetical protein PoB_007341600 [Plakobranchus ocellatus]|uniref:Uncharacterized protein n=1 Tax=Plakobranchus ocellatus TaxID=259542 RepID=A0AAV4DS43_9GAST|nr:hypothetical protein PoB_007341600 [Plakobranchus ocellatus]
MFKVSAVPRVRDIQRFQHPRVGGSRSIVVRPEQQIQTPQHPPFLHQSSPLNLAAGQVSVTLYSHGNQNPMGMGEKTNTNNTLIIVRYETRTPPPVLWPDGAYLKIFGSHQCLSTVYPGSYWFGVVWHGGQQTRPKTRRDPCLKCSRVRAPPLSPWPGVGPESLRSSYCGLHWLYTKTKPGF